MKKTIGIIGYGFVGKAVSQLKEKYPVEIYDPHVAPYDKNLKAFQQNYVFVCVPTPISDGGNYDLSILEQTVAKWREKGVKESILIIKSTISVGTVGHLCGHFGTDRILHNPEFLTQRTAMKDFLSPSEVIVGGSRKDLSKKLIDLYKKFYQLNHHETKYYVIDAEMAEMVKTVRNSYYATKVSFFNEIYELCESQNIDYNNFRKVLTSEGEHPWLAKQHTQVPGPDGMFGFGGACLPKDANGLADFARKIGVEMKVLEAAIASNNKRRKRDD